MGCNDHGSGGFICHAIGGEQSHNGVDHHISMFCYVPDLYFEMASASFLSVDRNFEFASGESGFSVAVPELFFAGGGISGDAVRMAFITNKDPNRKAEGVLSVFIDRGLGLYALLTLGAFAGFILVVQGVQDVVFVSLAVMALLGVIGIPVVGWLFYFFVQKSGKGRDYLTKAPGGKFREIVIRIVDSFGLYVATPGKMFKAFSLSLLIQFLVVVGMILLGSAMNLEEISPMGYAFATLWGGISNLIPITPGGLGVGEVAFDRVSHLLRPDGSIAGFGTVFLAYRVLSMLATLPGLVVCFVSQGTIKIFSQTSEEV